MRPWGKRIDTTRLGSKGEVCTTSQAHIFVTNFDQLIACSDFSEVARSAKRSQTGKRLSGALYVHVSVLSVLERSLQDYENLARQHLKKLEGATLVKFSTDQPRVSYLSYPDFDTDAHPALQWSVQVDLVTSKWVCGTITARKSAHSVVELSLGSCLRPRCP